MKRRITIERTEDQKKELERQYALLIESLTIKRDHCEQMLRKANTRVQRAVTIRRKWARRVAYYSRKLQGGEA